MLPKRFLNYTLTTEGNFIIEDNMCIEVLDPTTHNLIRSANFNIYQKKLVARFGLLCF